MPAAAIISNEPHFLLYPDSWNILALHKALLQGLSDSGMRRSIWAWIETALIQKSDRISLKSQSANRVLPLIALILTPG